MDEIGVFLQSQRLVNLTVTLLGFCGSMSEAIPQKASHVMGQVKLFVRLFLF